MINVTDTYPDIMCTVECDHHFIEEHKYRHNCVDTRSAHLQLRHNPEPRLRLVTALDDVIGSWNCYSTTFTIKCSEAPVGIQKALLNVAAHYSGLH